MIWEVIIALLLALMPPSSALSTPLSSQHKIASINLSQRWLDLVREGNVAATTEIKNPDALVKYGVRVVESDGNQDLCMMEFVQDISPDQENQHPLVQKINATLSRLQESIASPSWSLLPHAVEFERVESFVAQLQLVRTLRPPPSSGFAASGCEETTCKPPPYDASTDSFVEGPFRLQLRPLVGTISVGELRDLTTDWDVYHDVSPADCRGHFLLMPTLSGRNTNWRGQTLTRSDCADIVEISSAIQPPTSALICYNSMGAGASQNHIHLHIWPNPPIPLLGDEHAVCKAKSLCTMRVLDVRVSLLDYPVCCIKLSSSATNELGKNLGVIVELVQNKFNAPHDVGLLNTPDGTIDAFVFVRSRERSPMIVPGSRFGVSEMMGVFHTSSDDQLNELTSREGIMETALQDVSFENRSDVWEAVQSSLGL